MINSFENDFRKKGLQNKQTKDTKGVTRSHIQKDRQYNGQKDRQYNGQKEKERKDKQRSIKYYTEN